MVNHAILRSCCRSNRPVRSEKGAPQSRMEKARVAILHARGQAWASSPRPGKMENGKIEVSSASHCPGEQTTDRLAQRTAYYGGELRNRCILREYAPADFRIRVPPIAYWLAQWFYFTLKISSSFCARASIGDDCKIFLFQNLDQFYWSIKLLILSSLKSE